MATRGAFVANWIIGEKKDFDIGLDVGSKFVIKPAGGGEDNYELQIGNDTRWNGGPPPANASPMTVPLHNENPNSSGGVYFTATVQRTNGDVTINLEFSVDFEAPGPNPFVVMLVRGTQEGAKPTGTARGGRG